MKLLGAITFNDAIWFCASGKAFFLAIFILAISQLFALWFGNKAGLFISFLFALIGAVLLWLSSTPFWDFWGWSWLTIFVGVSVASHILKDASYRMRFLIQILAVVFLLLPIINESRYWVSPELSLNNIGRIYVIGDSVSSGLGGPDEETWPKILSDRLKIPVVNLAIAGATAQSAMKKQVVQIQEIPCMVLIEIGGNDLLNATNPEDFERAMRQILEELKIVSNQIAWLELPLLPWKTQYGQIQRRLAEEMKVTLIPKQLLSEVFQTSDTTSDSIHLTAKGHQVMAEKVSRLFDPKMK